ncbi:hypothetical protein [Flavobacterium silvaticum]|uniref:Uncharacterized protein n=1 Tax=Flavobacterium silvaticum TaxID=1852020 RepID=A0A972FX83_9FLAO|nr:hypothetical protein [Flavobacterium silvaticum]NMH26511.1 hypothetical protein [Flavobacterium silvaticum]
MNIRICLKRVMILSIIFLVISCKNSETKLSSKKFKAEYLVNKKDVSNLINFCMSSKAKIFNNCNRIWDQDPTFYFTKLDSLQIVKEDSIFTKEDLNFIFKQAATNPNLKINNDVISNNKLVPLNFKKAFNRDKNVRNEYYDQIRRKYGQVCTLSIPLFSKNMNIAIVKIGYSCGALCGEGGIYIYKKNQDGSWIMIKTLSDWVS